MPTLPVLSIKLQDKQDKTYLTLPSKQAMDRAAQGQANTFAIYKIYPTVLYYPFLNIDNQRVSILLTEN